MSGLTRAPVPTSDCAHRNASLIVEKAAHAEELLRSCALCERGCGIDRIAGERGACLQGAIARAYFEGMLWGEEACITPTYAIFFAGCNLRCAFCYATQENLNSQTTPAVEVDAVAERMLDCQPRPVSFSLIGGEPTVHLPTALRLVAALPEGMSAVWNSNFYFSETTASLLAGAMDVFIADLHFGNNDCAREIADVPRYLEVVHRNLRWARTAGALIVRHLVLPGHLDCCTEPALEYLAAEFPDLPVHLMTNYLPPESCPGETLKRPLQEHEAAQAMAMAQALGLRIIE